MRASEQILSIATNFTFFPKVCAGADMKKFFVLAVLLWSFLFADAATLNIVSASDYGGTVAGFPASNAIDGSTAWASRWVAEVVNGVAVNLELDLGSVQSVDKVAIAWGNGSQYTHTFEIRAIAGSGSNWAKIYSGSSSGSTESLETYDVTDMQARYVRIKIFSNSIGNPQQMIKEVEIYSPSASPSTPSPVTSLTPRPTARPTASPTPRPTTRPTAGPTPRPTVRPTASPTPRPTVRPTAGPTPRPTARPTASPTPRPTARPTASPVSSPTSGGFNLDPKVAPSGNFDLLGWYLSIPVADNDGYATDILEKTLAASYTSQFFYTGSDGAMVFYTPGRGVTTSASTLFIRTELRGMLRRGNTSIGTKDAKNNWAFSSIPSSSYSAFGGIDGTLKASLAVNHVTTTGTSNRYNGRIIVGQIHAKENEPCRLYYHKLPGNSKGSLYFAHETSPSTGKIHTYHNVLGSMVNSNGDVVSSSNPSSGITLNSIWSYTIAVVGNTLTITITQNGSQLAKTTFDMSSSGYDVASDYMYFKAGVYLQDNTCAESDYAQVSFYELKATHN